ncbi:MAG: ATP-binding protein [Chryseotalea sp.]
MQIRLKLTLQFLAIVLLIFFASSITLYWLAAQHFSSEFHQRLEDKAQTSAALWFKVNQIDSVLLKIIDRSNRDVLLNENISIYDSAGKEIYTSNDTIHFVDADKTFDKANEIGKYTFVTEQYEVLVLPFENKGTPYIILAGAIDVQGKTKLKLLSKVLLFIGLAMFVVVGFVGWIFAGRAIRPIKKIVKQIQAISPTDLSKRISPTQTQDEIGRLIVMINGLLTRVENAFDLQKTFVTNVSHELKNPLTKITSQLEVTLLKSRSAEEYEATLQSVLDDIKELNQLANSLLDLAFLHKAEVSLAMEPLRIDELLWEIRDSVQSLNGQYKVHVHPLNLPENDQELNIFGNVHLLKTAIQNIVENACKFSPDNKATVTFVCTKGEVEINVFDNGLGIEQQELEKVFQPFYRTDRTTNVKGHGIGLSLSQRIINIHNGAVEIESQPGAGTQVTILLKAKP